MKNSNFFSIMVLSMAFLQANAGFLNDALFKRDSLFNKTNDNITVQVKFLRVLKDSSLANPRLIANRKKLASNGRIERSVKYTVAPNKEIKLFQSFLAANTPLLPNFYWDPVSITIAAKDLSKTIDLLPGTVTNSPSRYKRYTVTQDAHGLYVETETVMK